MKYLYLGGDAALMDERIIGIFDLDNISWSHRTRAFLAMAEQAGHIRSAAEDIPRSLVLCDDDTVILAQPSTAVLVRRLNDQEKADVRFE